MSANSPERNLRSSTNIRRRKSIHENLTENDPSRRDKSPFVLKYQRASSKSPVRKDKLYPDLNKLLNDSTESISNDEEETEEHATQSDINVTKDTQTTNNYVPIVFISVIIAVLVLFYSLSNRGNEQKPFSPDTMIDCSQFIKLQEKFPHQNTKIFNSLKVSVEGVFNRKKARPSVFTFFSTDQKILDDLIKEVVQTTQECIRQTYDPINLTSSDLNREKFLKDHTKIIGEFKNELQKRTILVINNLDGLSSKVVPSLHSFTDTFNPLVLKSIIYITIKVPQKPDKPHDYIFTHLQQKWNDIKSNIRDPLITRLIDQTFFLEPSY